MVTPTENGQDGEANDMALSNYREKPVSVKGDRRELANPPHC
jgi:hypothetical protein